MLQQPISLADGRTVLLNQLVDAEEISGPVSVSREQGKRYATVIANVSGRDLVSFVEDAKLEAAGMNVPAGYYFEWGGQFENQQRAAAKLGVVVPIALVLISLFCSVPSSR